MTAATCTIDLDPTTIEKIRTCAKFAARKIWKPTLEWLFSLTSEDLEQEGVLGAVRALARYDAAKGASMHHFVTARVHGAMVDAIRRAASERGLTRMAYEAWARDGIESGLPRTFSIDPILTDERNASCFEDLDVSWTGEVGLSGDGRGPSAQSMPCIRPDPAAALIAADLRAEIASEHGERLARICELLAEGRIGTEIGAAMGLSESRVCQLLKVFRGRIGRARGRPQPQRPKPDQRSRDPELECAEGRAIEAQTDEMLRAARGRGC